MLVTMLAVAALAVSPPHHFTTKQIAATQRTTTTAMARQGVPAKVTCVGYLRVTGGWLEVHCVARGSGMTVVSRWWWSGGLLRHGSRVS